MDMKRLARILLIVGALWIGSDAVALAQSVEGSKEWPTYGHDSGGMRFSPLTQITPANVSQLKVAWVYHMRPAGAIAPVGRGAAAAGEETAPTVQGRGRGPAGAAAAQGETPPPAQD